MDAGALFGASVAVYAGVPLLLAIRRTPFQFLLLYTHIAALLTLGGLLGAVYVLPVGGDISLLAGQVAYGGFMFSTLLTVIVGRDLQVVRNIVVLTIAVNAVVYGIFWISHAALVEGAVPNPFGVSAEVFDHSLRVVVLGGVLILSELIALLAILELAKRRLGRLPMALVYVVAYIAIVVADGVLFPTLVLQPSSELGSYIASAVLGKLVLAAAYAVPLILFVAAYSRSVERYEATPLHLGQLAQLRRDPVLERLDEQQAELEVRTEQAGRATATVSRILDSATSTLLVAIDPQLHITHFNTGAQHLLGFEENEAIGDSAVRFYDDAELARHAAELGVPARLREVVPAMVRAGRPFDWELRTADGRHRVLSLTFTEIRDGDRLVGYLCAGDDVTGRLRAEEALTEALRREQEAVSRLEEADRVKDEVVSTISHELRTPIASIRGYTEMLADGDLGEVDAMQRDALAKVLRNTARLSALVEDLLDLDQVEEGHLVLHRSRVDLAGIANDAWDSLQQLARGRDLTMSLEVPPEPVPVFGDPAALERVVLNLGGNAVKFTPDGGSVSIAVARSADSGTLTVTDNGIGISEEDQRQVLGRFFRSSEAYSLAVPGTGLGLSVVDAIVTGHHGSIDFSSTPGAGTSVTVTLPALEESGAGSSAD